MKYFISLLLVLILASVVTMFEFTALGIGTVIISALVTAAVSLTVLKDGGLRFLWLAFAIGFAAIMVETGLHQAWAGYVLAGFLGVFAAGLGTKLLSLTRKTTA